MVAVTSPTTVPSNPKESQAWGDQPYDSSRPEPPIPPDDAVLITPSGDPWPRPYYLHDGLRRVQPYHFTYNTHCKERWRGRTLLDIFSSEFRDRPTEYYKNAIETGAVVLNGKRVADVHTVVKNGDVISHTLHRHEPPVTAAPIGIVHEDDDLLVINKPAGVPVHPAGRYNFNSVVEILKAERGPGFTPMPCNRLDRLTSGVMFLGKHRAAAERMTDQIKNRTVRKEYVARVVGEFPPGDIVCDQPILQISPKLGLNRVRATGKEARTVFRRLAYYPPPPGTEGANPAATSAESSSSSSPSTSEAEADDPSSPPLPWRAKRGYSIVRCLPLTGRTHQIRVHLQYLGHPISNDPIYSNQRVFGPTLGAGDATDTSDDSILAALSRMGKEDVAEAVAYHDDMVAQYHRRKAERMTGELCEICQTPLYSDPGPHELGIYLHARRYECLEGKWGYETDLPEWARPPEGYEGPTEVPSELGGLEAELRSLKVDGQELEGGTRGDEEAQAPVQEDGLRSQDETTPMPAAAAAA